MKLPYEDLQREIHIIKEAHSNPKYGCKPEERPIKRLIDYGIINVNKHSGPTSHQIADYVKKILNLAKVGHSGTLDPSVTGVLPIALGSATRIVQTLLPAGKEYVALMYLHKNIPEDRIRTTINAFIGEIQQLPPKRSAIKRQLRTRKVYYFDILEIKDQDVLFRVGCQAGTYIRKLCLHPKTDILTKRGMVNISNFYDNPEEVFSKQNSSIIKSDPSAIQKIESPKRLVMIKTFSGIKISATPDHKLLISTRGGYLMKEAAKLKPGDYLVKSLSFPSNSKDYIVADLLDDDYLINQRKIKDECKKAFLKKYGSIRAMHRELGLDRKNFLSNSKNAITIKHLKLAGIYKKIRGKITRFKTQRGNIIKMGRLNEDHFYLMGLIASDGNNTKEKKTRRLTRLKFHNLEEQLIDKFIKTYKKLFPAIPISKKKLKNGLLQLDTTNSLFASICAAMGIVSPQKNSDLLPILNARPNFIRAFLRGYFDGDGNAYFKKKTYVKGNYSNIRIYCSAYTNIKRIHQMLLKLGISNRIKEVSTNLGNMYVTEINNLPSKKKFIMEVGTNHPRKLAYFKKISGLKGPYKKSEDHYNIGFHFKRYLYSKRNLLKGMGGNLLRVLLNDKQTIKRGFYKNCSKIIKLPRLDNFVIERITKVEPIARERYVYDMTIPKTHNFLIETGFVSSNCHDFGSKLGCGAHMKQLVRTKVGIFTDKNWHSLQDLKDAYEFYKEGSEKELRKIILPFEYAVSHLPKAWVFDSAVSNLTHGSDLYTTGISKLSSFQKNEQVAVFTLKDELICLGDAVLNSDEILKTKKGLAINTRKVFLPRDIYLKEKAL